ncbi:lipase [Limnobacter sp.]|uniref:lipase family protein n=1 Tax=Limnobacter sp. TaxID=2003368 RepID=UPI0035116B6E
MRQLSPSQIYELSDFAYKVKDVKSDILKARVALELPFVDAKSVQLLSATSGLGLRVSSGFGFMAKLNGGRSTEIVIATRGTDGLADVATDLNSVPMRGPTGHDIHMGFGNTFKSYVEQLNGFIKQQNLGFRPTAVHCMGHSLGGALANLNAAACAELSMNPHLYTVAAPRVGMVPYAEHLSKKMNAQHVYRVANEADIVTMVPCFPFVHGPYQHGTHLLDGGMFAVNPLQHSLERGYGVMRNSSWKQLQSLSQAKQQELERAMQVAMTRDSGYLAQLARMPGAMYSFRLLKIINRAISDLLARLGAQSLLSVRNYGTGSFTVLDQLAEMIARFAQASLKNAKEVMGILNLVMSYLGQRGQGVADASMLTIRWVFGMLHRSVSTMAKMALSMVAR